MSAPAGADQEKRQPSAGAAASPPETATAKLVWPPGALLAPVPVVLLCTLDGAGRPNLATVAWTGMLATRPPQLGISLRPDRHSHGLLAARGECTVNLVDETLVRAADFCGVKSGRVIDKFAETGLTAEAGSKVAVPLVAESPLGLECVVRQRLALGSHELFITEVLAVRVAPGLLDASGALHLENAGLVAWLHGHYHGIGPALGFFGFSVRKKAKLKRDANRGT